MMMMMQLTCHSVPSTDHTDCSPGGIVQGFRYEALCIQHNVIQGFPKLHLLDEAIMIGKSFASEVVSDGISDDLG